MCEKLPRPRGRTLKRSNEELHAKYCKLAHWLVGRYKKKFNLTDERADDLEHSLLVKLFQAPTSYRNPAGIHLILRTKMFDLIEHMMLGEFDKEITVGLMQAPTRSDEAQAYRDRPDPTPHEERILDALHIPAVLGRLESLRSPERVVLGMSFGIDGFDEFDDYWIARRLGKTKQWVSMKRKQAVFKIQASMGLRQTGEGI
jgi:DNA-directed RNA polymerase specialized sigma24 family protein